MMTNRSMRPIKRMLAIAWRDRVMSGIGILGFPKKLSSTNLMCEIMGFAAPPHLEEGEQQHAQKNANG
jgi:hypothetical protein